MSECKYCGKSLEHWQKDFCSSECKRYAEPPLAGDGMSKIDLSQLDNYAKAFGESAAMRVLDEARAQRCESVQSAKDSKGDEIASLIDEYGKEKALEALKRGLEPWMVESKTPWHPLRLAFDDAVNQAMYGKGERHGGATKMFYDQQWTTLADCHGIGFLTGQAAKKLNEAAQKDDPEAWEREVLGAIVYAGMAILKKREYPE